MSRKTVLVTGASRGIGKAIAIKFARKGYNVAISCIRNEAHWADCLRCCAPPPCSSPLSHRKEKAEHERVLLFLGADKRT